EGACVLLGLGCTGRIHVFRRNSIDATEYRFSVSTIQQRVASLMSSCFSRSSSVTITSKEARQRAVLSQFASQGEEYTSYDVAQLLLDRAAGLVEVREVEHNFCANVSVIRFETATNTDYLVSGFNINTNKWMLE
ncbi:unnamed protein product, partial [Protopolystoma xenopodis]